MKTSGKGIFGVPGGEVTADTPDGVVRTFGEGPGLSSLTNSRFAHGGPDARGFGAWPMKESGPVSIFCGEERRDNAGVTNVNGKGGTGRFRID